MAKAVCLMSTNHGDHINVTLDFIRELVNRGEQVVYFFLEPYRERITDTGADFRPIDGGDLAFVNTEEDIHTTFGIEVLFNHARDNLYENKKVYQKMLDKVMQEQPDYIIHDSFTLWSKQIAKTLKLPAICTVSSFAYCNAMIEAAPELLMKKVLRISENALPKGKVDGLKLIINALERNLQKMYELDDFMDVFLAKEPLNLVFTSGYFQIYANIFDDSFQFVGPSFYRPKVDFPMEFSMSRPLIIIYMKPDFLGRHTFYQNCLTAFAGSDCQVVVSMDEKAAQESLGEFPPNFRVMDRALRQELFMRSDLLITNEGFEVVSEALFHEVPLLMLPYAADQSLLAHRVEELGAGIFIDRTQVDALLLKQAAQTILADQRYRAGSSKISDSFKNAGGFTKAADAVFAFKQQYGMS